MMFHANQTLADEQRAMARRMLLNSMMGIRWGGSYARARWLLKRIYGPLSLAEVIGCPIPTDRPYKVVASRNKREGKLITGRTPKLIASMQRTTRYFKETCCFRSRTAVRFGDQRA